MAICRHSQTNTPLSNTRPARPAKSREYTATRGFTFRTKLLCVTCVCAGFTVEHQASAAPVPATTVVVVNGDPAPDGNGSFNTSFSNPVLNDVGQVAFTATLAGTTGGIGDDFGIFRGDGSTVTQIVREGQAAPGGNDLYAIFGLPSLNNAGQVAFTAALAVTSGGSIDSGGIFRGDGETTTQIVRTGQATPSGIASFRHFNRVQRTLNNNGQVAFSASLTGSLSGGFIGDGSTMTLIARRYMPVPDGNGEFSSVGGPRINDAGQAAVFVHLSSTSGGSSDNEAVFLSDGSTLTQIVRKGQEAPDGNGFFGTLTSFSELNNAGQQSFTAILTGTSRSDGRGSGIFRGDGSTLTQIARDGQAAPDGDGTFFGFGIPSLNNAGQTAFISSISETLGENSFYFGIYRSDGSTLTQVLRDGVAAPDGNGRFLPFTFNPELNDAGQIAFIADLTGSLGGTSDDQGLYFFDDTFGLFQVAREGDTFLDSTITFLEFATSPIGDELTGLNSLDQVAFRFGLADGREGIAIWTVPEPGTVSLALLCLGGAILRRRHAQ